MFKVQLDLSTLAFNLILVNHCWEGWLVSNLNPNELVRVYLRCAHGNAAVNKNQKLLVSQLESFIIAKISLNIKQCKYKCKWNCKYIYENANTYENANAYENENANTYENANTCENANANANIVAIRGEYLISCI